MKAIKVLATLNLLGIVLTGCASFLAWNSGHRTMTADCSGLDEEKCNPLKTSSSFCCDQHLGWDCNPFGTPADSPKPGRCEYSGEANPDMPTVWCGTLGCEEQARRRDGGTEQ